jgi:hypothetical protein
MVCEWGGGKAKGAKAVILGFENWFVEIARFYGE